MEKYGIYSIHGGFHIFKKNNKIPWRQMRMLFQMRQCIFQIFKVTNKMSGLHIKILFYMRRDILPDSLNVESSIYRVDSTFLRKLLKQRLNVHTIVTTITE